MRRLVSVLGAGALACGDGSGPLPTLGPVRIEPAAHAYRPGATVSLTITNLSRERLHYSGCFYRLERQGRAGAWHLAYQDQSPCPGEVAYLEPDESRQISLTLPPDLDPAPHRARFPSIGAPSSDELEFIPAQQIGDSFVVQP